MSLPTHSMPSAAVNAAPPKTDCDRADRVDELMQIIQAYNQVTERLRQSHETLTEEVKRLQRQLASANAALQRSRRLAALGEMAAGIAHEVRNPLASIQLDARLLGRDLSDRPEQHELARRIVSAVRGLDAVVHDVLAFAREMKVRRVVGDAGGLLRRAAEALRPMIESAGVRVVYEMPEGPVEPAHDPQLMHRALVNLIRNAVQAMPDGGVLTLGARADEQAPDHPPSAEGQAPGHNFRGQAVQLTVRDTGPGIDEEAIDRIFNPFFTTRDTGTGLGLAIVHRIVDAHGGSIAVHNAPEPPESGAVFTLSLPAAADPPTADRRATDASGD